MVKELSKYLLIRSNIAELNNKAFTQFEVKMVNDLLLIVDTEENWDELITPQLYSYPD